MTSIKNTRPATILTANGAAPLLVSPITVAQRRNGAGAIKASGKVSKEQQNWMRQQWVANLKKLTEKKRLSENANATKEDNDLEDQGKENSGNRAWVKRLLKKRNNNTIGHETALPKPRTPRRKLNCGNAFEDLDSLSTCSSIDSSNVGRNSFGEFESPSDSPVMSPSTSSWWGHLLPPEDAPHIQSQNQAFDFEFDTRCLEDLTIPSPNEQKENKKAIKETGPPRLIRTDSAEQEALSQFFEHTHIAQTKPDEFYSLQDDDCDIDQELDSFYLENLPCFDDSLELDNLTKRQSI